MAIGVDPDWTATLAQRFSRNGKQSIPLSDCSFNLLWVYTVCLDLPVRKLRHKVLYTITEFCLQTPVDWPTEISNTKEKRKKKHRRSASFGHADKKLNVSETVYKISQSTQTYKMKCTPQDSEQPHNLILQSLWCFYFTNPLSLVELLKSLEMAEFESCWKGLKTVYIRSLSFTDDFFQTL